MLESLFIKNFVIVDELEISFEKGFSVLTGETGAGKSILIDALSLCLGQRSDFNSIRKNQDKADITATFNIESNRFAQDWLNEHDLEDGNQLILRRTLSKDGKSKGYINGNPVNINDLKDLSEYLIDIYGQNFHYSLLKPSVQREILDGFGKLQALLSQVKDAFQKWHTLSIDYDNYLKNKEAYEHERVELVEKIKEFKVLDFSNVDWQELQDKQKKMANSQELIDGMQACINQISNDDQFALLNQLKGLKSTFSNLTKIDGNLSKIDTLDSVFLDLKEFDRELNHYLSHELIDSNEQKMIEEKIKATFDFLRKYRLNPEGLEDLAQEWEQRLDVLTTLTKEQDIKSELDRARQNFDRVAGQLTQQRLDAAKLLSDEITQRLNHLSFKDASFSITLVPCEPNIHGNERIEFNIATFKGADLRPLGKVASGGELSRISLAIRVSSIDAIEVPTMIFDEVDVGIGGSVAETVGLLLKTLGEENNKQAFVITHLAQVAAQSSNHYKVSKVSNASDTTSSIDLLDSDMRIKEIARMIGGIEISEKTLAHARELLN